MSVRCPPLPGSAFVIAAVLSVSAALAQETKPEPLDALTVPAGRLPPGCELLTRDSRPGALGPYPANPWRGSDRRLSSVIRLAIEGPLPVPDGPPPDRAELTRFQMQYAEDVEQAYHAVYAESVAVYAVQMATTEKARSLLERSQRGRFAWGTVARARRDTVVALVAARASAEPACVAAIRDHVQSQLQAR